MAGWLLALDARVRTGDLAGLHDPLEAAEIASDLLGWLLAQQHGDGLAELAGGGIVAQLDAHLSSTLASGGSEAYYASVGNLGVGQGAPGDQLVGAVLDDLGVPLHFRACRGGGLPVRASVSGLLDGFEVAHDTR